MLEDQSSGSVSEWGGDGLGQRPVTALGRGIDGEISLPIGDPKRREAEVAGGVVLGAAGLGTPSSGGRNETRSAMSSRSWEIRVLGCHEVHTVFAWGSRAEQGVPGRWDGSDELRE